MSAEVEGLVAGRELDARVHEAVFGDDWRKECSRFRQSRCNGRIYTHCGACGRAGHGNCYGEGRGPIEIACADSCDAPAYSTDIAAAWLIVEWMRERGWDGDVMWGEGGHDARFTCADGRARRAFAKTAPEAICRAALQALAATQS